MELSKSAMQGPWKSTQSVSVLPVKKLRHKRLNPLCRLTGLFHSHIKSPCLSFLMFSNSSSYFDSSLYFLTVTHPASPIGVQVMDT